MTRVANEKNEDYLLMIAKHGSAWHMETLIAKYRRASRNMEAAMAMEQHERRECEFYFAASTLQDDDVSAETSSLGNADSAYLAHGPHVSAETCGAWPAMPASSGLSRTNTTSHCR